MEQVPADSFILEMLEQLRTVKRPVRVVKEIVFKALTFWADRDVSESDENSYFPLTKMAVRKLRCDSRRSVITAVTSRGAE
jgi:hypothetical protein